MERGTKCFTVEQTSNINHVNEQENVKQEQEQMENEEEQNEKEATTAKDKWGKRRYLELCGGHWTEFLPPGQ